jgi:hypothetical protein
MKTNVSQQLQDYLNGISTAALGAQLLVADLWTIRTTGGAVLLYTTWVEDITIRGITFLSMGPYWRRSGWKQTVGLNVDELTVKVIADPSHQINSMPFLQALATGVLDGAEVKLERLFMPSNQDVSLGTVILFVGTIADIQECNRVQATFTVRSKMELLNTPLPRNVYQPGCRNVLGDASCGVDLTPLRVTGVVSSGADTIRIPTNLTQPGPIPGPTALPSLSAVSQQGVTLSQLSNAVVTTYVTANGETLPSPEAVFTLGSDQVLRVASPPAVSGAIGWNVYVGPFPGQEQRQNGAVLTIGQAWTEDGAGLVQGSPPPLIQSGGYFDHGQLTFTSGVNNGIHRRVDTYGSGTFKLMPGLPTAPAAGDTFTVIPGCDKQYSTCDAKYHNLVNFPGQPFIPTPESGV